MVPEESTDLIECLGWEIHGPYKDGGYVELERHTPAGEDWIVTLGVGPDAGDDELARQAYDAYMGFDIAEELQPLIENRGLRGIPDDVFLLFADQIWKEIELDKLWQVGVHWAGRAAHRGLRGPYGDRPTTSQGHAGISVMPPS